VVAPLSILAGLLTTRRACTHCASADVRRSRQGTGVVSSMLGLARMRCKSCGEVFVLGRWLLRKSLEREQAEVTQRADA
jgi:hypothetical protein